MHDAGLNRRFGEGRGDRLGEALQSLHDGNQDVLEPAVAPLVHHRQPELGALIVCDPEAQNLANPFPGDAQGDVNGPSPLSSDQWRTMARF